MLKVEQLAKRFGDIHALRDVSFEITAGEIVGFVGPNGAGKSTTMRIIAGLMAPDEGSASLNGASVIEDPRKAQQALGYVPEAPALYPEMRVEEYLRFRSKIRDIPKAGRAEAIDKACKMTELGEVRRRFVADLSKGFRQRVALADVMLHDPKVMVLDEPMNGLDPNQVATFRNVVRTLAKERAILLSSHILSEIDALCDRVIFINEGKSFEMKNERTGGKLYVRSSLTVKALQKVLADFDVVAYKEGAAVSSSQLSSDEVCDRVVRSLVEADAAVHHVAPFITRTEDVFAELGLADAGIVSTGKDADS